MQIKRVTISGFKSYTTPVTIEPSMFTAITGLNGTGKSTILDALLFVLMKTTALRVKKVEELINSASNEAFVEVIFSNIKINSDQQATDTNSSYNDIKHLVVDECITMSRLISKDKAKFNINKQVCTSTFFKQVLKILIPHAHNTIMQGNITRFFSKNIKDIVNETAGTTGYEENSRNTIDVIKKKESKLCIARETLQRRISPYIEKLKSERSKFIEQRRCIEEKDKNEDLLVKGNKVLRFYERNKLLNDLSKIVKEYTNNKNECESFKEIEKSRTNEMDVFETRKLFDDKNRVLDLLNKKIQGCLELFEKNGIVNVKKAKIENVNKQEIEREIEGLREKELIITNEMKRRGLAEVGIRNHDAREKVKNIENMRKKKNDNLFKIHEISMSMKSNVETVSRIFTQADLLNKENIPDKNLTNKNTTNKKTMLASIVDDINACNPMKNNSLSILIAALKKESENVAKTEDLKMKMSDLQSIYATSLNKCDFPLIGGVHGTVAENFIVINDKHKEALEVILGSRLNYIIVDNEEIGTKVIEAAQKRVNVIPLNRIKSSVDKKKMNDAKEYGGINSLDLISYDSTFKSAFEYLFGGFYYFESSENAKKACFKLKIFTVCLEGNVYDPRGTVTGGKRKTIYHQGTTLKELNKLKKNINDLQNQLQIFKSQEKEAFFATKYLQYLTEYQSLSEENELLDNKIITLVKLCDESMDLSKEIEKIRIALKDQTKVYKTIMLQEENNNKNENIKNTIKEEYDQLRVQKKEVEQELDEISSKMKDNEIRKSKIIFHEKDKKREEERVKHLMISCSKIKKNITNILQSKKEILQIQDTVQPEILDIENIKEILKEINHVDNDDSIFIQNNEIGASFEIHDDLLEIADLLSLKEYLMNYHSMINEKVEECIKEKLYKARKDLEILNRPIISMNPKNFEFLEKNEEQINLIEKRISKLESDKTRILEKIAQLSIESEKQTTLALNYLSNAGHYLRYFIKDSDLRIDNEYNLFIKIGNWKDSLSELSGGQKSIVALSLIFAMLNYRPAPFYLFDEIDSALDTSYTQNIGEMIKKEFTYSQFVVISLKEEFFRNANSVFQVLTNDGRVDVRKIK